LPSGVELVAIDLAHQARLDTFVRGCSIVVDCSGPASRYASRVAAAVQRAGAHLVAAGSDAELEARAGTTAPTSVLYAAGALPGLSGLLPRWLAASFDQVRSLTVYGGVLDRFTLAGAEDYLVGVLGDTTEPLAALRHGVIQSGVLYRRTQAQLPFFPRELTLLPYVDSECRQVAQALSLAEGSWYVAVDGQHLAVALDDARAADPRTAALGLCRASALDVAGRKPYVRFLIQLEGLIQGVSATRTALLQAPGIASLTGATAAAVTLVLQEGGLPRGVHAAAALPDPQRIVERLATLADACELTVFEHAVDELTEVVGGTL
jgi:hypothetical protein